MFSAAAAAKAAARNDGRAFEYYSSEYHRKKYDHTVWHASVIPEAELFAAGVFHDYNSRRMLRNANLRDARTRGGITSPYVDDGLDFLVKKPDEDPSKRAAYYPGQAKNYAKKSVCANDLAGFYRNMMKMHAPGYLYTTTRLDINLREDLMQDPSAYTHERLDFDPTTFALTQETSHSDETTYGLRDYQKEAASAILERLGQDEHTKMILHVGCGLGKTLIAGRVLAEIKNKRKPPLYVCIAPLRVSVTNLKDRLSPFFTAIASLSSAPQFRTLLVDSDSGGTTDPVHIGNVLKTQEPIVIFSTYESFFGLLTEEFGEYLTDEDAFLVADEIHNLTREQCKIVNEYQTSLLMSATVPEKMKEILDATEVYRYTMADGIRDGYLCDYEVYLPLVKRAPTPTTTPTDSEAATPTTSAGSAEPDEDEDASYGEDGDDGDDVSNGNGDAEDEGRERTAVDVEFPYDFPADDITAKALFLCTGMLHTGSRRCIVYLRGTEECALFTRMFKRVCEEYQGLRLWSAQMDYTVGSVRRSEILRDFQADSEQHDLFVIASVRILDEAVDIPRCDSEFITYVGDYASDIRTIQRLQRGGRLDPTNPSKRNSLFLWTEEWSRAVNSLTLMRQEDPLFHKKLRTLSANYDRLGEPAVQRDLRVRTEKLQAYAEIQCVTLDDMWERRRLKWCEIRQLLGRDPSQHSGDVDERRAAVWRLNQCASSNISALSKKRIQSLKETEGWTWTHGLLTFDERLIAWREQKQRLGREPSSCARDVNERTAAIWRDNIRKAKRIGMLPEKRTRILNECPGWLWEKEDNFEKNFAKWRELSVRLGRAPSRTSRDADERRVANWKNNLQNSKKTLPEEQVHMLSECPGWAWTKKDNFAKNLAKWYEISVRLGRSPSSSSRDADEKRAGVWCNNQRTAHREGRLSEKKMRMLNECPSWKWPPSESRCVK